MAAVKELLQSHVPTEDAHVPIPELSDAGYFLHVLQLAENHLEDHLVAKANALGISTARNETRITSSLESASTVATYHARTFSLLSNGSSSTAMTNCSSLVASPTPGLQSSPNKHSSKDVSFLLYDKYLKILDPNYDPSTLEKKANDEDPAVQSVVTSKLRRSLFGVPSRLKNRISWRKKTSSPLPEAAMACTSCRNDFKNSTDLHHLPCGHTYCGGCLNVMVDRAISDETRMPPRCCHQPLPGFAIKEILNVERQHQFIKATIQCSTPWKARIFCPNTSCREFIPPRHKVDLKRPFSMACPKCSTRVCIMCKRMAHPTGKDCPNDWELDEALKTQKYGLKRCYKCRNLVELTDGPTRTTCHCKADFCGACGAGWDPSTGCPNSCHSEEELSRRKIEEEASLAEYEAEKAARMAAAAEATAERLEAEERSRSHAGFQSLLQSQREEMQRFRDFVPKARSHMQTRHAKEEQELLLQQREIKEETETKHERNVASLEDRQVAAEMELRSTLETSERSVKIRLKHMEAYCDDLRRDSTASSSDSGMPGRTVTARDMRELRQQYNLRDGMERLHQAKINVMRDRQARRMEELQNKQETEMENLFEAQQQERDDQVKRFANEEEALTAVFAERKVQLIKRWELGMEVLQKELEAEHGTKYAVLPTTKWQENEVTEMATHQTTEEQ